MSTETQTEVSERVPQQAEYADNNGEDVRESVEYAKQLREFRKYVFYPALGVCCLLFLMFIASCCALFISDSWAEKFIQHKNILIIHIAVLVSATITLWGIVRAVFTPSKKETSVDSLIKEGRNFSPYAAGD